MGGWVEENEAVGMRCWMRGMVGLCGGERGGSNEVLETMGRGERSGWNEVLYVLVLGG